MPVSSDSADPREQDRIGGSFQAKAELRLFSALEVGSEESQASLSKRVGAAVGLVNALLKRAVRKGTVKMISAPARRYSYYLTPKGFAERAGWLPNTSISPCRFFARRAVNMRRCSLAPSATACAAWC